MKKVLTALMSALIFTIGLTQPLSILANDDSNVLIEPRADIIEWRYKVVNGKLYKRLFNYSKNQWIGDWILA